MDNKKIQDIVDVVLAELKVQENKPATKESTAPEKTVVDPVGSVSDGVLPELGSDEFKNWIGVENPHNEKALKDLRASSVARVCVGRAGARLRTNTLLRFLADHSRSRDTVFKEIPQEWIEKSGMFMVQTQVKDKDEYLTRPDKGRRLQDEARKTILEKCQKNVQVQVVLSDGLSTDALTANFDEILPPLLNGLKTTGLNAGIPFFVKYGRVKMEDEVGELLDADVVVLLVGERPGLGQSESLSAYIVYKPTVEGTVESDRTCISNIHNGGTPPVEASAVIVDTVKRMIEQKTSGINLR